MAKPKVALLGAILESNRFAPLVELIDFKTLTWLIGDDLMVEARSDTPLTSDVFLRNLLILFVPDAYRALHRPFQSDSWILLKR